MFTDSDKREEFSANRHAKAKNPSYTPLYLYCLTNTSEMHEKNECLKTGSMSAYGRGFKLLSKKFAQASVDRIIGN